MELKIDFSEYLWLAGDVARSGLSDRIAINGQDEEATWQPVERPIARGFSTVDASLK